MNILEFSMWDASSESNLLITVNYSSWIFELGLYFISSREITKSELSTFIIREHIRRRTHKTSCVIKIAGRWDNSDFLLMPEEKFNKKLL